MGIASLAALAPLGLAQCAPATDPGPVPLRLGVSTHFGQGWPERLRPAVARSGAATVREAISWRRIETQPGRYTFDDASAGHVRRACQAGQRVVLVTDPRHPAYDSGRTADSGNAQLAFGRFVAAVAGEFGACLTAVEVGNEINGLRNMDGPAAANRAGSHARLLEAVWRAVKPAHPAVVILGGSVNTVGTGFLDRLFTAGALGHMDGVAIHPYRNTPEGLGMELAALNAAMARHGVVRPIWATEFGSATAGVDASDYLVEMACLLNAGGVADAQWYALADDAAFPTMGLLRADGLVKPAGAGFAYLATRVLPRGPAMDMAADEPALHRFRFGSDREVLWGAPRALMVPAGAIVRNSAGEVIPKPSRISASPVLVEARELARLGPREVLADSLYDYARTEWTYLAGGSGVERPLRPVDSTFATTLGLPALGPLAVNPLGMVLPAGSVPLRVVMRYRAEQPGLMLAQVCLIPRIATRGSVTVTVGGVSQPVPPTGLTTMRRLALGRGEQLEFAVTAAGGPAVLAYRFRVTRADTPAAGEDVRCS